MPLIHARESDQVPVRFVRNRGYIYIVSAVAALGGLLFGFDMAIISGTITFFSSHFQLNEFSTGWAVGCINIGAALGAAISGWGSNILGRKKLLLICALLFAATGVGTGWAPDFTLFIIFRLMGGIAIGAAALVCPMYIAEISPAFLRGRLVAFYQLAITVGILLAYLSNYLLLDTGPDNWRWMFSSQTAPSILFLLGLLAVSESPRWLIGKKRIEEANDVLEKIGGAEHAAAESLAIKESFLKGSQESLKCLYKRDVFHIVIIGIAIAVFSQVGGQNSILSYAPEIFREAGISADSAFLQAVLLGLILSLFTLIAIVSIDRAGRKSLLMCGALLLAADAFLLFAAFHFEAGSLVILLLVLMFIAIYSATLGPVTWVMLSEIFPNRIRGHAMSIATLSLWISNFFTVSLFPVMKAQFGIGATFGIHGLICLLYFVFLYFKVPETKGKSLEQIEQMLIRENITVGTSNEDKDTSSDLGI